MDEKLRELWKNNKLSFFLLLIPIVLLFFGRSIIEYLIKDGGKIFKEAQQKDSELRADETAANTQANDLVKKAEEAAKPTESVGDDWYKKK